ncbi:hypothetical protein LBW89_19050 [Paenibacillus sp. alder61]|uniref:Uncharacterized protein n=1 Tax=Paenibacillus faecis TaxID=862114 RepID=A0A5D0CVZ8_9BACL|nr:MULTISPECIES: hypothetical protein [Paenibacillus]MCA1295115.1 hypothetical protein [Paenibacillus sp. alder61]TYA13065.1 hypothetical protein FRY98_10340 [Paenibacillus faecis]
MFKRKLTALPKRPIRKGVLGMTVALAFMTLAGGCMLAPSQATLDRQAVASPWWLGPFVTDGVYAPTVEEEVYSKETIIHPQSEEPSSGYSSSHLRE